MIITLVSDIFYVNNKTAAFSALNLAEKLSQRGHKIRVLTYGDPPEKAEKNEKGFEIYYISNSNFPLSNYYKTRQHNITKAISGADAVHIFQPSMLGRTAERTARRQKVPVVAGFYNKPKHMLYYLLLRFFFYRRFEHIHCTNKFIAAQLRSCGYKAWLHVITNNKHLLQEHTIRRIERMYLSLCNKSKKKNDFAKSILFELFSRLFYAGFAVPLMKFWMRVVLGAKICGKKNMRGIRSAVTVCNHVHFLDSVLVGLALFPKKATFPTLVKNVKTLWPGKIVRVLGGVAIPETIGEVNTFFTELEFLLKRNHIVHFFPEGVLRPYDTSLISFKKGAFYLAAHAHVPIVPMLITFEPPKGIYKILRKKPVMTLHIGKPIDPYDVEPQSDMRIRMKLIFEQMNSFAKSHKAS